MAFSQFIETSGKNMHVTFWKNRRTYNNSEMVFFLKR